MKKTWIQEFKEFALKGNVIDLAVGVIIGVAFGNITSSLIGDVLMPVIGVFLGGVDLSVYAVNIKPLAGGEPIAVNVGVFLQTVIDFLILALIVFFMVKGINRLRRKPELESELEQAPPPPSAEQVLLTEIRDILKDRAE